jgi:hypothetical protein
MTELGPFIYEVIRAWTERCIPKYEPALWNDGDGIENNNNCYNYACNIQTGTDAEPGRAHNYILTKLDCADVVNGVLRDGLVASDSSEGCGCQGCCHLVALCVDPGRDFHLYRRDRDGRWSHKIGPLPARNTDSSGNLITDPRSCDRGRYSEFCGFYCVCREKVTIR